MFEKLRINKFLGMLNLYTNNKYEIFLRKLVVLEVK